MNCMQGTVGCSHRSQQVHKVIHIHTHVIFVISSLGVVANVPLRRFAADCSFYPIISRSCLMDSEKLVEDITQHSDAVEEEDAVKQYCYKMLLNSRLLYASACVGDV